MKPRTIALAGALLAAAFCSSAALAHHSNSMFDRTKVVTLQGTVKEFQWTNPHTWIELEVAGAQGAKGPISIEGPAPGVLRGKGWKFNSIKTGDKVTVQVHPLRDGSIGGGLMSVTLASGEVLTYEPPAAVSAQ